MPNAQTELYELFLACFTPDELRVFIRSLPQGPTIVNSLPGATVNASQLAYEAADLLRRHGVLGAPFFQALLASRPLHEEGVRTVARSHGVSLGPVPTSSPMHTAALVPNEAVRILMLASNPTSTALALDREVRNVRNAIEASRHRDRFELESRQAVRVDDLVKLFLTTRPDVVHFSGFGAGDSGLVFADNSDRAALVHSDALRRLFAVINGNARAQGRGREIRAVVLNACMSAPQAEAISKEVDCVIGMSNKIPDSAAVGFATTLYTSLVEGESVEMSFELARIGNALANLGADDVPRLLERTPGIARTTVFGR